MEKMLTPFRMLDKADQRNFAKKFGKALTGLQFNKFYNMYTKQIKAYGESVEEQCKNRDFFGDYSSCFHYKTMAYMILRRIFPQYFNYRDSYWAEHPEQIQSQLDLVNSVIDYFFIIRKREAKAEIKQAIVAESEGFVTLSELKKELWMFFFSPHGATKLSVSAYGGLDWKNKTARFRYRKYKLIPASKTGYYNVNEVKKLLLPLIAEHQAELNVQMDAMNKINAVLESKETI